MYRLRNASPILPIGRINLETGKSKYFNIYDTWGEDTTYEIWRRPNSGGRTPYSYYIVATSGKKPLWEIGQHKEFMHDQTRNRMFDGTLVDFAVGTELKDKVKTYGKSLFGAAYK